MLIRFFYIAPPFMNFDGVDEKQISASSNNFQTQITVSAELYHWMNTSSQKCYTDKKVTNHFKTCQQFCSYTSFHKNEPNVCLDIFGAVLLEIDNMDTVCMQEIRFLRSECITEGSSQKNGFQHEYRQSDSYNQCVAEFCTSPCDEWKYNSYVTSVQIPAQFVQYNLLNLFFVSYQTEAIFESRQVESQSWSTIIGNIGGIVGLWLWGSCYMHPANDLPVLCCVHAAVLTGENSHVILKQFISYFCHLLMFLFIISVMLGLFVIILNSFNFKELWERHSRRSIVVKN